MVTRLRHVVDKHQDARDIFIQPLKYGYNTKVYRPTGVFPFGFVPWKHSPRMATFDSLLATPSELSGDVSSRIFCNGFLVKLAFLKKNDDKRLSAAQRWYQDEFEKRSCQTPVFKKNELFFLEGSPQTTNINTFGNDAWTDVQQVYTHGKQPISHIQSPSTWMMSQTQYHLISTRQFSRLARTRMVA